MPSNTLLHFGDQTGEVLPSVQELSKLASCCQSLHGFFRRSTHRLRRAIAVAPARYRHRFPFFDSPLELAAATAQQEQSEQSPALTAALLCIAQLGHVIVFLESHPRALDSPVGENPAVLGICTGLLTAAAISCCRNLTEVLSLADEVVELAFHVGLESSRRSELIDSSTESWATLVTNLNSVHDLRTAVDIFNDEHVLIPSRKVYISAESLTSATISGPPSTTAELFTAVPLFQSCKKIPLPISAAFHASHLEPVPETRITHGVSNELLATAVQHHSVVSPGSGQCYSGTTFGEMLGEVIDDILQKPISMEAYTRGLCDVLGPQAALLRFGPVNSAKAIRQSLYTAGVELHDASEPVSQLGASSTKTNNAGAIAIVGMSVRLPGSETLEEFWKVLEDGRDLHEKIRPDRFNVETHCDPSGKMRNTTLTPYGVFIDRPGYFDTRLFNMSPREAAQTDPQQRLLLLTTYEALEMAGYSPNATPSTNTRRIGSWIGQTSDDYREVNASQNVDTYFITGGIRAFGPGRLNYHFGWEGPSYSVDTACSSNAASIQLACSGLLARECDMAVGGGANFLSASDLFAGLSRGSFLSKTGGCKTFDHDADGYVRADAVGVVVLKRLDDAIADRDNILAVLRGAVTNHSAEAVSITHPHAETQERLFNAALNQAGLQPHDIDYAELHGTGTQAGDATESRSVTNVLARGGRPSQNPLYIGTVKPNLGHGEAASGVTSIIKAVMMLRKNMIPPHVGIKGRINKKLPPLAELNTHISFGKTPFLPRENARDGKRRILVNNFDAAGGNTSMVIEDPPTIPIQETDPRSHHIVVLSGKTPNAILDNSKRLLEYVTQHPDARLEDIAYTTTARRMHHVLRQTHVVSSADGLALSLKKAVAKEEWAKPSSNAPPSVVFLFTGQGSQYLRMGSELFNTNSTFREAIEDSVRICVSHGFASFLPLITGDHGREPSSRVATPMQVQLAIVAIELAVAALWKALGVTPTAVMGHSLGEYPALCIAGVISLSDCLYLVGKRASLMLAKCTPGTHSMLAVQASEDKTEALMSGVSACEIACVNGPSSTVVSGPVDEIARLGQLLQSHAVKSTVLEVQFAFHSASMDQVLPDFVAAAEKVHFSVPRIPFASTVLGTTITGSGIIGAEYLGRQTRENVQFLKALRTLKADRAFSGKTLWVEVGPNPTCLGLVRSTLPDESDSLLPSLKRNETQAFTLTGKSFIAYELAVRLLELPSYAFDLKNYWIQYEGNWAIRKGDAPTVQAAPPKEALPVFSTTSLHRIESEVNDATAISVTFATDANEPKLNKALRGHLVNGAGLCPSSVYADMAFTAAGYIQSLSDSNPTMSTDVRNMQVHKPLLIQAGETRQVIRVAASKKRDSNEVEVKFGSQDGDIHEEHAHCTVIFGDGDEWKSEWARNAYLIKSRMEHLVNSSLTGQTHKILQPMVYKLFAALVDYDSKYQGLREVYMDSNLLEATASVRFATTSEDGQFTYSPYWIDSLAHLSGFVLNGADTTPADAVYISHGWGSMKIVGHLSAKTEYRSYVRMQETKTRGVMSGDVYFFEGEYVVAVCQDLKFQRIQRSLINYLLPPPAATKPPVPTTTTVVRQPPAITLNAPKSVIASRAENATQTTPTTDFSSILNVIASEVGVEKSELSDDAVFADLGVDSLLSISITAKLSALLGRDIAATLFAECLSVKGLRGYFENLNLSAADGSTASSDASTTDDDGDLFSGQGSSEADTPISRAGQTLVNTPKEASTSAEVFRKIIANEVGVEPEEVDNDTPLADLGVDSLLSLSILSAIKAQTGQVLPSSFLIDNPTLAAIQSALGGSSSQPTPSQQLVRALEKAQGRLAKSSFKAEAVLLQGSALSQYPAVFLLPDGSGSASSYVGLPRLNLPGAGAVYGLSSPFLDAPKEFTIPLQEVAAMYVSEIRRVQPRGPYHLAGWSIGGTYAFEAASQLLQRRGEQIASLTLIDAPCPKKLPPLPIETIELLDKIGAFDGLKAKNASAKTIREGVRDHFAGSVNALKQYKPVPSVGITSVTVLWAKHGVWETVGDEVRSRYEGSAGKKKNAAADWIMDPRMSFDANGWETLLPSASIRCEVVTGDHFSIMRKPGIMELGSRLAEAITG